MRILGIDPATPLWATASSRRRAQLPPGGVRGHHHSRGGGLWPAASGNLPGHGRAAKRLCPEAAAVEKLYFSNNKTTGIGVAEARGVILLSLAQHGVPLYEYTPMQVKQAVTGYGKALKPQVQEMTRRLLHLPKFPSQTTPPTPWLWPSATARQRAVPCGGCCWNGTANPTK